MRGKAWAGLRATGTVGRVAQTPAAAACPLQYFWQHHCARPYKEVAAVDGTGRCALDCLAGYAPAPLDNLKTPGRKDGGAQRQGGG